MDFLHTFKKWKTPWVSTDYDKSLDHFYTKNMGNSNNNILNHFLHYILWNNGENCMLRYAPSGNSK